MSSQGRFPCPDIDVVIIGAGISGINAAYRIQKQTHMTYTILEARDSLGGTWDLFDYPGVRSDSDMYTFGFSWFPWMKREAFGRGDEIWAYIEAAALTHGIDHHIQYGRRVLSASWSSEQQLWHMKLRVRSGKGIANTSVSSRYVIFGTGYYDYHTPLQTVIPGLDKFQGHVVHPQSWPEQLDVKDKHIVIIGSGATAVTLVPELAKTARRVTMLQRSPSYIMSRARVDSVENIWHRTLPARLAYRVLRWKNILMQVLVYHWCRASPKEAKEWFKRWTSQQLPSHIPHSPHFEPRYNPWDQRLCLSPDGDFFTALRRGKATVVTDNIRTMAADSIILNSGSSICGVDMVVTATGLKVQLVGGIQLFVDDKPIHLKDKFLWNGVMLQDVPNAAFLVGNTHESWTLRVDNSTCLFLRVVKMALSRQATSITPVVLDEKSIQARPLLNLSSTYLQAVKDEVPKAGDRGPWRADSNFYWDFIKARTGYVGEGLELKCGEVLV